MPGKGPASDPAPQDIPSPAQPSHAFAPCCRPDAPKNLVVSRVDGKVSLTFDPYSEGKYDILEYEAVALDSTGKVLSKVLVPEDSEVLPDGKVYKKVCPLPMHCAHFLQ